MQYKAIVHQPNYNAVKKEGNWVGEWNQKAGIGVLLGLLITRGGTTQMLSLHFY